jgi:hypothetical protein
VSFCSSADALMLVRRMRTSSFILVLLGLLCMNANANDVFVCGGFVKSSIPIDFSLVSVPMIVGRRAHRTQVRILTGDGTVKFSAECAPNNGYFFLPVYDKVPTCFLPLT